MCGLANVVGPAVCELHSLYHDSGCADAELQRRLIDPNQCVTKLYGVGGLKAAMDMFGFYGGPTRSPLPNASVQVRRVIEETFVSCGFSPK